MLLFSAPQVQIKLENDYSDSWCHHHLAVIKYRRALASLVRISSHATYYLLNYT